MTITFVSTAITSTQLGRLVRFFPVRYLLVTGCALYSLSMILIPLVPDMRVLLFPAIVYGVAQGINLPNLLALLTGLSPMEHRAAFLSINWVVVRFGQTIRPVLGGLVFWDMGNKRCFLRRSSPGNSHVDRGDFGYRMKGKMTMSSIS